jgi:hypothetical protein
MSFSERRFTLGQFLSFTLATSLFTLACADDHEAISEYADALCAQAEKCECSAHPTQRDCVTALTAREVGEIEELEAGGAGVSWDCLAEPYGMIAAHIRAAGCVAQVSGAAFRIRQYPMCIWGDAELGEACETNTDCERDLECDRVADVCRRPGQIGDACETFFDCKVRSDCLNGRCITPAVGQPCDTWCPEESYCARDAGNRPLGICVLRAAEGGGCSNVSGCEWGAYCHEGTRVCEPFLADGQQCSEDDDICWATCERGTCSATLGGVCAAVQP